MHTQLLDYPLNVTVTNRSKKNNCENPTDKMGEGQHEPDFVPRNPKQHNTQYGTCMHFNIFINEYHACVSTPLALPQPPN